jgi:hypothetical protein
MRRKTAAKSTISGNTIQKNTSRATCSYLTDAVYICHPLKQQNQSKDGSKN